MLSCCAFAQADLNIFVFTQLAILQVKTSTFTNEQRQLASECLRYDEWQKKNANYVRIRRFNFDSACAGLSVSAANINLCGGQRTNTLRLLRL